MSKQEEYLKFSKYGLINKQLSSKDVCYLGFSKKDLEKLTLNRLKKFRTACYKEIGNRFYCCKDCCCLQVDTPELVKQKEMSDKNLEMINKVLFSKCIM